MDYTKKVRFKEKKLFFHEIFLALIDKNIPPIPDNLLFVWNIEKWL